MHSNRLKMHECCSLCYATTVLANSIEDQNNHKPYMYLIIDPPFRQTKSSTEYPTVTTISFGENYY